nr:myb/SANT-like DNA-binding domain-containing protein 4 [Pogona vitticeps]
MTATKVKRIKFSDEEKFLILEEFTLRKDILVPKNGRYKNTADRQQAWEEIARAVNSLNPVVQRTPEEIRKKWKNMVVDAQKELMMEKHPLLRKQPRDQLLRDIFALLHMADGVMPKPSLYDSGREPKRRKARRALECRRAGQKGSRNRLAFGISMVTAGTPSLAKSRLLELGTQTR